jgi:hypothetical protein
MRALGLASPSLVYMSLFISKPIVWQYEQETEERDTKKEFIDFYWLPNVLELHTVIYLQWVDNNVEVSRPKYII